MKSINNLYFGITSPKMEDKVYSNATGNTSINQLSSQIVKLQNDILSLTSERAANVKIIDEFHAVQSKIDPSNLTNGQCNGGNHGYYAWIDKMGVQFCDSTSDVEYRDAAASRNKADARIKEIDSIIPTKQKQINTLTAEIAQIGKSDPEVILANAEAAKSDIMAKVKKYAWVAGIALGAGTLLFAIIVGYKTLKANKKVA